MRWWMFTDWLSKKLDFRDKWVLSTDICIQMQIQKANKMLNLRQAIVKVLRLYFSEFLFPLLLSIWTVYLQATIECSGITGKQIETWILSLAFRFWSTCRYLFIQIKYPQCCLLYIFVLSSCQRGMFEDFYFKLHLKEKPEKVFDNPGYDSLTEVMTALHWKKMVVEANFFSMFFSKEMCPFCDGRVI